MASTAYPVEPLTVDQWFDLLEREDLDCVELEDGRVVELGLPRGLHGITEHLGRRRDLGQDPAVGATEPKFAVRLSVDLVALLVDRAMVAATE